MDTSDWRAQLQPQLRKSVVKEIMDTVKLWHAFNDENELELEKVAQSFERKTYAGATSQSDYFHIIRSKMVSMEGQTKEEVYQKIQVLKDKHLQELNEIYQRFSEKFQREFYPCPEYLKSRRLLKLEKRKAQFERVIEFLQISKSKISPSSEHRLALCEKFIMKCKDATRPRVAKSSQSQLSYVGMIIGKI